MAHQDQPSGSSPFAIEGPAVISFSGGRTSGYMLRRILDEGLRSDVHVLFADTGKEFPATYRFVDDCSREWGITIHRVERRGGFTQLITDKKFLPNPIARFCTSELKIAPINNWMVERGYEAWTDVMGLRADEPRRVARARAQERDIALPLADAGITRADVMAFWRQQPFNLRLQPHESNCDLCFMKGYRLRQQIAAEHPERVTWWMEQEARIGGTFRSDTPAYKHLLDQRFMFEADESLTECYCHD